MALSLWTLVRVTIVISVMFGIKMKTMVGGMETKEDADSQSNKETNSTRLPDDLSPLEYFLTIEPKMYDGAEENFTFCGTVELLFHCRSSTNKLVMHSKELELSNIRVKPADAADGDAGLDFKKACNDKNQFLTLDMAQSFVEGRNYTVSMDFQGPLTRASTGLCLSSYKNATGKDVYQAYTILKRDHARKVFPCMDEPHLKAFFTISVIRRPSYTALSNMPLKTFTSLEDDQVKDTFQRTPKMSTYLVAFVVSDFKNDSKLSTNGTRNEVWSQPSKIQEADFALDISARCCDFLEHFFQISYPLPKLINVAFPDKLCAMENWGLIIYGEGCMLYKEGVTSADQKKGIATYVAHAWTHMWFGNLVTLSWWDDLWLNEGFAHFMQYFIVDRLLPEWKLMDTFVVTTTQEAMDLDHKFSSHPLYANVKTADEALLDEMTYYKSSSIVHMVYSVLGEGSFRKSLKTCMNKFKYKSATHLDLWTVFNEQAQTDGHDIDLVEVMNTWTRQMNYPVVSVTVNGDLLTLTQERFIENPDARDPSEYTSEYGYKWFIPFTYITKQNATRSEFRWMKPNVTKMNISVLLEEDDWVLGNVGGSGYFRVNYDADNWKKLSQQLHENPTVIGVVNRAQLIDDAFNLAKRGYIAQNTMLDIVDYMNNEIEFSPWYAAEDMLNFMRGVLHSTNISGLFKEFVADKAGRVYKKLSPRSEQDSLETIRLRELIERIACANNYQLCIKAAMDHFYHWKNNTENNTIPLMARKNVYCTAMRNGTPEDWHFLYRRYVLDTESSEKFNLIDGLACSARPYLLQTLLNETLTSEDIPQNDGLEIMIAVAKNKIGNGTSLALDFVKNSWTQIAKKFGAANFYFLDLIESFGKSFSTTEDLKNLDTFQQSLPEKDLSGLNQSFQTAKETLLNNIKWVENYKSSVNMWLQAKGYGKEDEKKED